MTCRVCVIGGGSFGSVVARVAARGVQANPELFHQEIAWWVRRPELAAEINDQRTNSQYLGQAPLSPLLKAGTDMGEVASGADVCIMALPGQFVADSLPTLNSSLSPAGMVVSLIKSLKVVEGKVVAPSQLMQPGLPGRSMAALMGPNIYTEMAKDEFAEATVGCADRSKWPMLKKLFETPEFHVEIVEDLIGVELCGALKNTVTISCGFADGMGLGANVRAAIIRRGLLEIGQYMKELAGVEDKILFQACGIGDLLLSCTAGRGRILAAAFVKHEGKKSWSELEDEIMNGMRLPDQHNVKVVYEQLQQAGGDRLQQYPLLARTYEVAYMGAKPETLLKALRTEG